MTHSPDEQRAPAPLHRGSEFPMLDIPFNVVIDGRRHVGEGLSLIGAQASGLINPALHDTTQIAHLIFEFPGFTVTLTPEVRVQRVDDNRVELLFTEPTGSHVPQLRQILGDWISGDLTSTGSMIRSSVMGEPRIGGAAPPRRGLAQRIGNGLRGLMVLALTLALLAVAAVLVQSRLLTTDIVSPGRIVPEGDTLRATADGQISFLDTSAAPGDVLFAIDTVDGETLAIAMPCDCTATPVAVTEGSTILTGEPVVALSGADAPLVIDAQLPQDLLFAIARNGNVTAEMPDGSQVSAALPADFLAPAMDPDGGPVHARLVPHSPLPPDSAGKVVALSVPKDAFAPFQPLSRAAGQLWDRAGAAWNRTVGASL